MLIFDGYDELSSDQLEENNVFMRIVNGNVLPSVTTVITSRPFAMHQPATGVLQGQSKFTAHRSNR